MSLNVKQSLSGTIASKQTLSGEISDKQEIVGRVSVGRPLAVVELSEVEGGHKITVTDPGGVQEMVIPDGKDGYTPEKGVDYFDGKDGYTPVKGIDYWTEQDVAEMNAYVTKHNTNTDAHNDIRLLITGLTNRLNALADSDDTTLDQWSEMVAYIKANRTLIENVTTNKVNVSDIINNLTTSVTNKPLSAKQGVVLSNRLDNLRALVEAINVPTTLSELAGDSNHRTVTDEEKDTWNAKLDQSALQGAAEDILAQAKESGDFDGPQGKAGVGIRSIQYSTVTTDGGENKVNIELTDNTSKTFSIRNGSKGSNGERGTGILKVTTAPSSYTTAIDSYTPKYRMSLSTIKSQSGVSEVLIGDVIQYSYYQYQIDYLTASYAYISKTRVSLRGAAGDNGTTPHIGDNDNWFLGETDTGVKAKGSDANVTEENIKSALGYTPADKTAMDGLSEEIADLKAIVVDGNEVEY